MLEDQLVKAAKALTDDEVDLLARYLGGESMSDIAITMEMTRAQVTDVVMNKGGKGTAGYIKNVLIARRDLSDAKTAAPQAGAAPSPARQTVTAVSGDAFAAIAHGTPARRNGGKNRPRGAAAPARPVTPAPEPASDPVDVEVVLRQAETPVTASDQPVAAGTPAAAAAAADTESGEDTTVAHTTTTRTVPAPRTADLTIAAAGQQETVKELQPGAELLEVLAAAEGHTSEDVRAMAKGIREQVEALRHRLGIEQKADAIRAQIAELDGEIDERVARRDALRAQLEALFAGDVVVSASAGHVRRVAGEPDAKTVREWAGRNGFEVHEKGIIPGGVMAAYKRANGLLDEAA